MKHRSKFLVCCLALCWGSALRAQESPPESKGDPGRQQPATQEPQAHSRVRVSRGFAQSLIVKKVQPEYPQKAREQRIQGEVVLKIAISREGDVSKIDLISGGPLLVPAAMDAVKQWKYQPYLLNGSLVEVETQVVVTFSLGSFEGRAGGAAPADVAPTGVAGDAPGGIPADQQSGAITGIISSVPVSKPGIADPERVRVSQGVSSGLVVTKVPPEYPEVARRARIQGTVVMHAIISKAGDIASLELVSGHPLLVPAAIEAVKQWKYRPYMLNGRAVAVDTQILVNFTLSGN
jgi:TonB family protein